MKNQKNAGILLSYVNTALNMCFSLFLTPMLIAALSDTQYGVYKVMQSFAGPLMMLNLGMSTIVARSVARYWEVWDEQTRKEKENTFALAVAVSVLMAMVVLAAGCGLNKVLPILFADTYTPEEIALAERLLMVFACTTSLHIVSDTFRGCILGRERFLFYYGSTTIQYILRFCAIAVLICWTNLDAVSVAIVDLILYAGLTAVNLLYCVICLRERMHLYGIRKQELLSILSFSAAVLLQALINQVNNNLDNVILGAMIADKRVITMYSSALSIYSIYNSLLSVLANVYFPKAARMIAKESSGEELTDFVIGPGRIQAAIAVAVLCAFSLFGGNFVKIWIGEKYMETWWVALALMIPVTIPLVQNLCLAILNARLKQLFRSVVLSGMAVVNALLSIAMVSKLGYWGAALGTVLSLLIGHGLVMNLYYARVLKMNVLRMFREIFAGILPSGLLSMLLCLPAAVFVKDTLFGFFCKCLLFVGIYALCLWKFGLREGEKRIIFSAVFSKR